MVNRWRRLGTPIHQMVLTVGMIALLAVGVGWLSQRIASGVQTCLHTELYHQAVALRSWFVHEHYYLRDEALLLVDYDDLFAWLALGETPRLRHVLALHQRAHEEDVIYLVTDTGKVYTAAENPLLAADEVRTLPLVQEGFHGKALAELTTLHERVWLVAVAPHVGASGAPNAVVVIARQLDPAALTSLIGGGQGAVLLTDGTAWVVPGEAHFPAQVLDMARRVAAGAQGEVLQPYDLRLAGQTYAVMVVPLETTPTGRYALALVRRATVLDLTRRKAIEGGITLVVLFVFLAGVLIWFHTRDVFRPLRVLTQAARRVAEGDLDTPIHPVGNGDLYALGQSMETMRERLQGLITQEQRLRQRLASRLEAQSGTLEQMCRAREQVLGRLITAQEEERRRVSRELHDETSQELANLIVRLGTLKRTLDDPQALAQLEDLRRHAARALEGVNRIVMDLRPGLLDTYGLVPAVQWYAENRLKEADVAVAVQVTGTSVELNPPVQASIYRVLQEAINNIAQHAQARHVALHFVWEAQRLHVEVSDDGRGFEVEAAASAAKAHFGLIGMRERVGLLGGRLQVISAPGKGTRLVLDVPYTPARTMPDGG